MLWSTWWGCGLPLHARGSPELRQVHGQIAEFLGGQYLARRAEQPTSQQALVELKQLLTRYPVHLRLSASDKHLSELSSLLCAGDGMAFCRLSLGSIGGSSWCMAAAQYEDGDVVKRRDVDVI